ncbi:hypothetical protein FXO37_14342 [Capsicum annuum]|nr:hypothetical protein FXO37_14342 [Capsicum annuum]
MHVCVKGNILRFSIYEFALITGLKCFGNVENFKYDDSSPSRLMRMYFSQSTNEVDKEALVERFLKGNFETIEDALRMAILYFIHTLIYLQLNVSHIPFSEYKMVEDEKYEFFPWGQVSFSRNELLVKANLDSLESEIKTYVKTYIDMKFNDLENVINDRFCEVLKSLPSKNETVEKKNISKQSRQDGDSSDVVVDVAGPTSADSLEEETDKSVEMKKDKVNQAPSPLKNSYDITGDSPNVEMEVFGDWIKEDLYKQHMNKYTTNDCFFKVYIDKAYVHYYSADDGKELATQDAFARTDGVAQMEMSLINTIKGLSTRAAIYVEYLSKGLAISSSGIDAQYHRLRYTSFLCKYGFEKAENGYFSENDNPPRSWSKFSPEEIDHVLHIQCIPACVLVLSGVYQSNFGLLGLTRDQGLLGPIRYARKGSSLDSQPTSHAEQDKRGKRTGTPRLTTVGVLRLALKLLKLEWALSFVVVDRFAGCLSAVTGFAVCWCCFAVVVRNCVRIIDVEDEDGPGCFRWSGWSTLGVQLGCIFCAAVVD